MDGQGQRKNAWRIFFRVVLAGYICLLLFLCFGKFDSAFIQEQSKLFNLTDKDVHFLMFIPWVPLCFLSFGTGKWSFAGVAGFALALVAAGAIAAVTIEYLQGLSGYRSKDMHDAIAGIYGASAGALLLMVCNGISRLCRRRQEGRRAGTSANSHTESSTKSCNESYKPGPDSSRTVRTLALFLSLGLVSGMATLPVASARPQPEYQVQSDSLSIRLERKTGIKAKPAVRKILRRGGRYDFYFSRELGDYPWHGNDIKWFQAQLRSIFADKYGRFSVGEIFVGRNDLKEYITPVLGYDGHPSASARKAGKDPSTVFVSETGKPSAPSGLEGRNLAVWQSHGYYYEQSLDRWEWQRACLFRTVEDIFTQSFVTQFLVPMLENAGAYVLMPRERDLNRDEYIIDNDPMPTSRGKGSFRTYGRWEQSESGFADRTEIIGDGQNPFEGGSSLMASGRKEAAAEWIPEFVKGGEYAVYVAYRSFANSTSAARYIVEHKGGTSEFTVNQKMGGGTWIYLGTFDFAAGSGGKVRLVSSTDGSVTSADAVRFGGGMGNVARGNFAETSGLPRYLEAARYSLQWYGAPRKYWNPSEEENDYKDDYTCRGLWTGWISGGSAMNPEEPGLGIPLDLSLGFHTDAGTALRDSTIGTMAIYTSVSEGKKRLPSGESRLTSREYAEFVQSQVVNDIRQTFCPEWRRREIKDRAYLESRTPVCPAMLIELLSHQNFADMKLGLDPAFRFVASRAVYKGILKYLSNRYGRDYVVQPLPVESFAMELTEGGTAAQLSWRERTDSLEPTAAAEKFLIEKRVGDGGFSRPSFVEARKEADGRYSCRVEIPQGEMCSFRVSAWNRGGKSFPSEILSVASVPDAAGTVLIVNNFDRVSAPVHFEDSLTAGFYGKLDSGAEYIRGINYVGDMYDFRKDLPWMDDDCPGFGASYTDCAGICPAGNSFDYPSVHGRSLARLGYSSVSMSAGAFAEKYAYGCDGKYKIVDLICGKQLSTPGVSGRSRFSIWTPELRSAVRTMTAEGASVIVSGSYIASDASGGIHQDMPADEEAVNFISKTLGIRLMNSRSSRKGGYRWTGAKRRNYGQFNSGISEEIYTVESPDGIVPAGGNAQTVIRYSDSGISAAVAFEGDGYRAVSFGFPIECVSGEGDMDDIFRFCTGYFNNGETL